MTLCNLSIEGGARLGMIAPDSTTLDYINGRSYAPTMDNWDAAIQYWQRLNSDKHAVFDREVTLEACDISPTVSWGITPEQSIPIDAKIPNPDNLPAAQAEPIRTALEYMGLEAGQALEGTAIDQIFLGSCTNARIEDIRAAAAIIDGHRAKVPGLVSPGSTAGKRCASTTNRNFRGRQGIGSRTHLMSPAMVAAAAIHGKIVDVRNLDLNRSQA